MHARAAFMREVNSAREESQVINRIRQAAAGLSLVALVAATNSWAVDRDVSLSYDEAWKRTLQTLTLEGVTFTVTNKETGIIQGMGAFQKDSKSFTCTKVPGRVESYTFNISAVVRESPTGAVVSVKAEGSAKSFQYRRLIFIRTSRVYYDTPCPSTGTLEESLLKRLSEA